MSVSDKSLGLRSSGRLRDAMSQKSGGSLTSHIEELSSRKKRTLCATVVCSVLFKELTWLS
jgi:hypothetical protein